MSDLNLSLILRLVDKATGPAREAMRRVQKMGGGAQEFGRKQVAWADKQIEKNNAVRSSLMGQTGELMAMGAAFYALTEPAIQAEKRMAAISKFVEFKGVDGLKLLQKDIRDLVTTGGLSMTADGISEIVAAAGQMGVVNENLPDDEKRRQLLQFATDAGKMAVAFDLSAEQAGKALARWRQNFHLTHDEAMLLGDAINVLGNTMITNEADIVEVMQRQGVEAIRSGLGEKEGAALAATMLSGGAAPEVAATGMKNFLGALTDGENATKKVRNAYSELGMDPEQVAVSMQNDASGTILEVMKALEGVEDHRRQSVAKALFGKEAWEAIGPLVANRKLLEEALGKVEDDVEILGKMNEEYQRQAATTDANRTVFINHIKALSVAVGSQLLPMLNEMMEVVSPLIMQAMEWIEANPELAKTLGWVAVSLIGLKAASLALRWPLVLLTGSVLRTWRAFGFAARGVGWFARSLGKLGGMKAVKLSRLVTPLKWTKRLLPAIRWGLLAGPLSWRMLIRPLIWGAKFAGRALIGPIGWALLAGELAWYLLIKPLGWDKYIYNITWDQVAGLLSWRTLITPLSWLSWINPVGWVLLAGRLAWKALVKLLDWEQFIPKIDFSFLKWSWDWIPKLDLANKLSLWGKSMGEHYGSDESRAASARQRRRGGNNGARALGGPVRAGFAYKINELGQEVFMPNVAGRVLNARDAKALMEGTGINIAKLAPIGRAAQGAAKAKTVSFGDINITVAGGGDPASIVQHVKRALKDAMRDAGVDLHDGGAYAS